MKRPPPTDLHPFEKERGKGTSDRGHEQDPSRDRPRGGEGKSSLSRRAGGGSPLTTLATERKESRLFRLAGKRKV